MIGTNELMGGERSSGGSIIRVNRSVLLSLRPFALLPIPSKLVSLPLFKTRNLTSAVAPV